jgi:uncharacterized protein (TIGR00730 family)
MKQYTITIFGSSLPVESDQEYQNAYSLSKKLAKAGFNICSGGSMGIMDAVSKAASEEGKEAIGVTVEIFNAPSSKYLTNEIRCSTLSERLDNLVTTGDAFILLPGGTGTLLELSFIWELMNKNVMKIKPAVCYGEMWKIIVEEMEKRVKLEKRHENLIMCFDDKDQIVDFFFNKFNMSN